MKKGFTLLELLITIVVIGILASIAIPTYVKTVEKSKADRAITNLKLIRVGEGIYKVDNNEYVDCADLPAINANLRLDIQDDYFDYNVDSSGTGDEAVFTARATRNSGPNDDEYIEIDQDGDIDLTHWSP